MRSVEKFGLDGPSTNGGTCGNDIAADIIDRGYDKRRGTFTQYYGSAELDAALLMIPLVGFLPADDERVRGTLAAIEQELLVDGYVQRTPRLRRTPRTVCRPVRGVPGLHLLAGRQLFADGPAR